MFAAVDLYPVTCEPLSAGRQDVDVLEGVIAGGAKIIQLRDKESSTKSLYEKALQFRECTKRHGLLLIINDRVDLALAVGADGVHIGQDDLPVAAARHIAPELLIGASTHSLDEALAAQVADADYVNIGPIFPTKTKDGLSRFLGAGAIHRIAPNLSIPYTVMGGINAGNIEDVLRRGARRIAVVSAVTMATDIADAVRTLRHAIRSFTDSTEQG